MLVVQDCAFTLVLHNFWQTTNCLQYLPRKASKCDDHLLFFIVWMQTEIIWMNQLGVNRVRRQNILLFNSRLMLAFIWYCGTFYWANKPFLLTFTNQRIRFVIWEISCSFEWLRFRFSHEVFLNLIFEVSWIQSFKLLRLNKKKSKKGKKQKRLKFLWNKNYCLIQRSTLPVPAGHK